MRATPEEREEGVRRLAKAIAAEMNSTILPDDAATANVVLPTMQPIMLAAEAAFAIIDAFASTL